MEDKKMKKQYMKPCIGIYAIRKVELLNASDLNSTTAGGNESLGRGFNFNEDEY